MKHAWISGVGAFGVRDGRILSLMCGHLTCMHTAVDSPHHILKPAATNTRRRGGSMKRVHEVEPGLFTPLVVSATGGMGIAAETFYKCLASLISEGSN